MGLLVDEVGLVHMGPRVVVEQVEKLVRSEWAL